MLRMFYRVYSLRVSCVLSIGKKYSRKSGLQPCKAIYLVRPDCSRL